MTDRLYVVLAVLILARDWVTFRGGERVERDLRYLRRRRALMQLHTSQSCDTLSQ